MPSYPLLPPTEAQTPIPCPCPHHTCNAQGPLAPACSEPRGFLPATLTLDRAQAPARDPFHVGVQFLGVGPGTFVHLGDLASRLGRESA